MTKHGQELAADLSQLMMIAHVDIAALVSTYAAIVRTGNENSPLAAGAFLPPVADVWMDLWLALQDSFASTASNLEAAGSVLLHVISEYKAADTDAGAALQSAWKDGPPQDQLVEGE